MTRSTCFALPLVVIVGALIAAAGAAQTAAPVDPVLAALTEPVRLNALDTTLGRAADSLSRQSGYYIISDPRYYDLPVSAVGADGTLGEVLSALCLATGVEPRRLDRFIVLSATRRGVAVVARQMRAQVAGTVADQSRALAAQRAAATNQAMVRLGLGTLDQALAQLDPDQFAALRAQGYLTVAQLFPRFYHPLYDYFSYGMAGGALRPPTLPEFAGTRVYADPTLSLDLRFPGPPEAPETVWPIDVIASPGR